MVSAVVYTVPNEGALYVVAESCTRQYTNSSTRRSHGILVCVGVVHQTKVIENPSQDRLGNKGVHTQKEAARELTHPLWRTLSTYQASSL